YVLLFAPAFSFLTAALVVFGYSVASFQLAIVGENRSHVYWSVSLAMASITIMLVLYARRVTASQRHTVQERLDDWFKQKYEDAWSRHDDHLSWSGFDSKLAELAPNDGVLIRSHDKVIFASGCFQNRQAPAGRLLHSGDH